MSNIDKQALREVAEKATPGPWLWINTGSYFSFLVPQSNQDPHSCIIDDGSSWGEYGETINPESPDGVFIAAANPAAVLALLDELEADGQQIKTLESRNRRLDGIIAAAENRIAELQEHRKADSFEVIYQCEFCHHDSNGDLQWHWEDVNKAFYDQYDVGRRGNRRVLYTVPNAPIVTGDISGIIQRFQHQADHLSDWHHIDEHSCKVNRRDLMTALEFMNACRAFMLETDSK